MEPYRTIEMDDWRIEIRFSRDVGELDNPRDWDNLSHMYCYHGKYRLGDWRDDEYGTPDYVREAIAEDPDAVVIPLSLYDHGGIRLRPGVILDWDCGQVGWAVAWSADIEAEYGDPAEPEVRASVEEVVLGEISVYDAYLAGQVYEWSLSRHGHVVDCVGGYVGWDGDTWAEQAARECLDWRKKQIKAHRQEALKAMIREGAPLAARQQRLSAI